jgi:hypothetical protein
MELGSNPQHFRKIARLDRFGEAPIYAPKLGDLSFRDSFAGQ